ncbi:MAG: hypothetical protein ACFFEW_18310 [Candidatus Thorarchaeota archaeon]
MNRKRKALLVLPIIVILIGVGYTLVLGIAPGFDDPTLEFPISETGSIERLSAYHTPDWGEPGVFHNGIDLVISDNVTIVSPVAGTIVSYSEHINPYAGNVLFEIGIAVNWGWSVGLVLEPGFLDTTNNSLQSGEIDAVVGQRVEPGDALATLLFSDNYPHLHYALSSFGSDTCAYNYSSPAAKTTFESIAAASNSTIFYPYPAPNVLTSPLVLIPLVLTGVYAIVVLVVFRRGSK